MKKFSIFISIIALLIIALMPLCVGLAIEYGFKSTIGSLASTPEFAITDPQFERGYRTSKAHLILNTVLDGLAQQLSLDIQFQHGPLLLGAGFRGGLLAVNLQVNNVSPTDRFNVAMPEKPIYSLEGQLNFLGNCSFSDTYNPFSVMIQQGVGNLGGGQGSGRIDLRLQRLFYEGHLNQLNWHNPGFELQLADLNINKEISLSPTGLNWITRIAFQSARGSWNEETYELSKGAIGVARGISEGKERWQLSLVADKLTSQVLNLDVVDANLALNRVPIEWVEQVLALTFSSADQNAYAQKVSQLTQTYLQPNNAQLVLERFGAVEAGKSFWFSGQTELAALLALPPEKWQSVQVLLKELEATGEIHLDKSLLSDWISTYLESQNGNGKGITMPAAQIGVFAQAFVGQGLLTDEGSLFSSKVQVKHGEITLNGLPMPLPF